MAFRVICFAGVVLFGCETKDLPADTEETSSSTGMPSMTEGSSSTDTPTGDGVSGTTGTSTTDTDGSGSTDASTTAEESGALGCSRLASELILPASSTRDGAVVAAHGPGARFAVPAEWLQWHDEFGNNLHVSRPELEAVRVGTGDWDSEYSHVLAALFDYDCCAAHVGGEGWGAEAVAYSDLQLRVYLIEALPGDVVDAVQGTAWELVDPEVSVEAGDPWTRVLIRYSNWYGDYGGDAFVDLRLRRYDDATVVYAGMYSDGWELEAKFDAVVAGECWTPGTGECA